MRDEINHENFSISRMKYEFAGYAGKLLSQLSNQGEL